jgi:hypothetical protein
VFLVHSWMLPRRERVVFMALKSTADAIKKALFKAQKWARKCETPRVAFLVEQIFLGDVAQLVRALPCHGRGRGFEPRRPRHTLEMTHGAYGPKVTTKSGHD